MSLLLKAGIRRVIGERSARQLGFLARHGPRRFHVRHVVEIDGWLTEAEALALHDVAARLPGAAPVAVEIGCWLGKSSYMIGRGLRRRRGAVLYCIDPFNAPSEDVRPRFEALVAEGRLDSSLRDAFWRNVTRYGLASTVRVVEGYSDDVIHTFTTPIDFLFIDGMHEYEFVSRDVSDWAGLVKPGGSIALHDVRSDGREQGPWRVTQERLTRADGWEFDRHVDSLWVAKKRPHG